MLEICSDLGLRVQCLARVDYSEYYSRFVTISVVRNEVGEDTASSQNEAMVYIILGVARKRHEERRKGK